ncbi:TonB-dependent receptor [Archangium primigenium]|uniref:TonB-dependent receptor n=1 Tax=[Archangium] primigenium TaxID=2792470 RepID=UPI00195C5F3A|nr:TonB-dependent receptor [Archangium primigenium]MBM7115552.1 TonB-dependent receptor [Archangium primigenium]
MRALVLGLLLAATGAWARERLSGTVRDAETGQPLPDVVVTATSPNLQGEAVGVTDVQGVYRFEALPEGRYTLRFDGEAFKPLSRYDVAVTEAASLLDVELRVETELSYIYVHPCGPPVVDIGSTETGWADEAGREFYRLLPVSPPTAPGARVRSFDSLVGLPPGLQDESAGVSIRGASFFENPYVLDGLFLQDPVLGLNPLPLSVELLQDLPRILSGGHQAGRVNGLGGVIEVTTPEGSNELHGSVFGTWTPGGRLSQMDLGATLGGAFVKDRLYFFAGVAPGLGWTSSPGLALESPVPQALARLTYAHDAHHHLSLSLVTSAARASGAEPVGAEGLTTLSSLRYRGFDLGGHLFTEASLGWTWQSAWRTPGGLRRQQAQIQATWWAPFHLTLQAGASADRASTEDYTSTRAGGFLQASMDVLRGLTVNAGARYDVQSVNAWKQGTSFSVGQGVSPRVGLVADPLREGRMRLFAHYAKYQGPLLLGLLAALPGSGVIDPKLTAPASHELLAGAEYELWLRSRIGLSASRHWLDTDLAHVRGPDGVVLLGNPGQGLATSVPAASRTRDALSLWLERPFFMRWSGWLLRASYTWARLSGNDPGPFVLSDVGAGGLAPRLVSDALPGDASGFLPLDRTHTVRLLAAREFELSNSWSTSLGLAYRGRSGTPLDPTGAERTPWEHDVDARWVVGYARPSRAALSFSLEVYNLLGLEDARAPRQGRLGVRYDF